MTNNWKALERVVQTFARGVLVILFWAFAVWPSMFAFIWGIAWSEGDGPAFAAIWGGWGVFFLIVAGIQWFFVLLFVIYAVGRGSRGLPF